MCASVSGSLTVDNESNLSAQVSVQVVEIRGCALVLAGVCALDRFQCQESALTSNVFALEMEGQVLLERGFFLLGPC